MLSAIVVLLYFTPFFSGFIVDFQQVNVNWAESKKIKMKKKKKKKKKKNKIYGVISGMILLKLV